MQRRFGAPPFSGADAARPAAGSGCASDAPLDAPAIARPRRRLVPGAVAALAELAPAPTIDLTVHFRAPLPLRRLAATRPLSLPARPRRLLRGGRRAVAPGWDPGRPLAPARAADRRRRLRLTGHHLVTLLVDVLVASRPSLHLDSPLRGGGSRPHPVRDRLRPSRPADASSSLGRGRSPRPSAGPRATMTERFESDLGGAERARLGRASAVGPAARSPRSTSPGSPARPSSAPRTPSWRRRWRSMRAGAEAAFVDCNRDDLCMSFDDFEREGRGAPAARRGARPHRRSHRVRLRADRRLLPRAGDLPDRGLRPRARRELERRRARARYGDAGVYSFYATKTVSTGEGGMLVSRHAGPARVRARLPELRQARPRGRRVSTSA